MIKRLKKWLAKILRNELLEYVKPIEFTPPKIVSIDELEFERFKIHGKIEDMNAIDYPRRIHPEIDDMKTALLEHIRDKIILYKREDYRIGYSEVIAEIIIGKRKPCK